MIIKLWRKSFPSIQRVHLIVIVIAHQKMQLNILINAKRKSLHSSPIGAFNVEHDKGKLTSNYTISLIIHNEVFDVSLQVDIFSFSLSVRLFIRLIMLETREE